MGFGAHSGFEILNNWTAPRAGTIVNFAVSINLNNANYFTLISVRRAGPPPAPFAPTGIQLIIPPSVTGFFANPTPFAFAAGDRISVRVERDPNLQPENPEGTVWVTAGLEIV